MDFKDFITSTVIPLVGLVLFCAGYAAFISYYFLFVAFLLIFMNTFILAYFSRHPLSGFVIGLYIALTFLIGLLFFAVTKWLGGNTRILYQYFNFDPQHGALISVISAVIAVASLGIFSGLLGYVFARFAPSSFESKPIIFRDYWSQFHSFGKSKNPEYQDFDRRLAGWNKTLLLLPDYLRKKLMCNRTN